MDPRSKAIELVRAADALILDFDGPICDFFAGFPAAEVARKLIEHVDFEIETDDPLDVLRKAVEVGADVEEVDRILTGLECLAAESAVETPGARELIQWFDGPVGIASNNASQAIRGWLESARLTNAFVWIEGRAPRTMKPHPRSLLAAVSGVDVPVDSCVFLGDSSSDLDAAQAVSVAFIGLAEGDKKAELFAGRGYGATIRTMADLTRLWRRD